MHIEDDRDCGPFGLPGVPSPVAEMDPGVAGVRMQLATLMTRLAGVESDLAALKTGMSIIETRLTGIEARQRHAESRRERIEVRLSDFDFGVDRVHSDMATLKDRVRCVELDLRELSRTLYKGSRQGGGGDTLLGPLSHAVSRPVGYKRS